MVTGDLGMMASPADGTAAWTALLGLGSSAFPLAIALLSPRARTSAGAVSLSGFVQGVGYAIAPFGPVVVGVLYSATVACRPVMLEDTWCAGADGATVLPSGEPRTVR